MEKELRIGDAHDRLTENEEVAILKVKNGTRTIDGIPTGEMYYGSFTGGLGKNIWDNRSVDWIAHRNVIERYFVNLFKWDGATATPAFKRELEMTLFRHGKVAVFKAPDGNIYPSNFTYTKEDTDYYGDPTKITLVHHNSNLNGIVLNEGEFVAIFNNTLKHGTLDFLNERMRQMIRALKDVDNASIISRPKWGINVTSDDAAMADAENAMNSDKWLVPMGNINLQDMGVTNLAAQDATQTRIDGYLFQRSNLLKLLGLTVNGDTAKAERQTELEVARSDEFDNILLEDMWNLRNEKLEELRALGADLTLGELPQLEEPESDKTELNGEQNKKEQVVTKVKDSLRGE